MEAAAKREQAARATASAAVADVAKSRTILEVWRDKFERELEWASNQGAFDSGVRFEQC